MTDWIKHTTDTCPVDPETVVEVRYGSGLAERGRANEFPWWMRSPAGITHYRIITPAKPAWLDDPDPGADPAKPLEPEMAYSYPDDAESYAQSRIRPEMNADAAAALKRQLADAYRAGEAAQALKAKSPAKPEPDLRQPPFPAQHRGDPFDDLSRLITLRLECLKLALQESSGTDYQRTADIFLHYVLNGSVDKA